MPNDSHVFYHNLSIKNNIALDENEKTNMYKTESCVFHLVKIKDNIVFAKSEEFNFENSKINNPFKVNFYDQNNSKIPAKYNDEEFKLMLLKDEKIIAEFPTGNLNNNLNLKHDEYSISPNTVIQLTSTNQKIDLLAEFQIH